MGRHGRAVGGGVGGLEDRLVIGETPIRSPPSRTDWRRFPRCAQGMREGRLSLDQVGVIAGRAADGSDEHYAELARSATVSQLRTAVKLEPRPDPEPDPRPEPEPRASITKTTDDEFTCWRIKLAASGGGEVRRGLAVSSGCADR